MVAINIDDYLTCPICKEIFSLPVLMISGCQHNYCSECFSGWLQELIETARRTRQPESLRCPMCRGVVRNPQDDLQRNRMLSGLVEDYWKAQEIVGIGAGVDGGAACAEGEEPMASGTTGGGDSVVVREGSGEDGAMPAQGAERSRPSRTVKASLRGHWSRAKAMSSSINWSLARAIDRLRSTEEALNQGPG